MGSPTSLAIDLFALVQPPYKTGWLAVAVFVYVLICCEHFAMIDQDLSMVKDQSGLDDTVNTALDKLEAFEGAYMQELQGTLSRIGFENMLC